MTAARANRPSPLPRRAGLAILALAATVSSFGQGTVSADARTGGKLSQRRFIARIEDPSGEALQPFFEALQATRAGERSTRIVYLGDSHVANDRLTGQIRRRLQRRFGNGGLGFFLPARATRHYRHDGVLLARPKNWSVLSRRRPPSGSPPLGFSGYGLLGRSDHSKPIALRFRPGPRQPSKLRVFVHRQPRGGKLLVRTAHANKVINSRGKARLMSRSIALRAEDRQVLLQPTAGEVLVVGVAHDHVEAGVTLDVAGVNGARARDLFRADHRSLAEHLRLRNPNLLVLGFGTNEAMNPRRSTDDFERELRRVVNPLLKAAPDAGCLLVGPTDHPRREGHRYSDRPATRRVIRAYRRVGADLGCAFIDLVRTTGGRGSMLALSQRTPQLGANDLTHLTIRGYRKVGNAIGQALLHAFDRFDGASDTPTELAQRTRSPR